MQNKQVFISYSWDSEDHQQWILFFANELRKKGLIAHTDVFETQQKSTHLNKMMVEKVRDSDILIVVLTENYARKADSFEGGVGFESQLTLPFLLENPNKLVPIMRQGDYNKSFPFHLKGFHAIDFRTDEEFEEKFDELIYRLYEKPLYHVEPIGEVPTLEPRIPARIVPTKSNNNTTNIDFSDLNLTSTKRITDRDIDRFMKESFKQIIEGFQALFSQVQSINPEFEFDQDDIGRLKSIFNLYIDGNCVNRIKIWYGGFIGRDTINLSFGRHLTMSDNSMNEMISYEIDEEKQIKLKMTMNYFNNKQISNPEEIVKEIWKNNISHTIS